MKSLRKKMSKQIQDDKCHNVSSMTVEGIRKMLLIQKMTLRQNVKKSLSQATKTEKTVTPLYIYVGYRYSLLNTSCLFLIKTAHRQILCAGIWVFFPRRCILLL